MHLRPWSEDDAPLIAPMREDPHLLKWSSLPRIGAERWIAEQRRGARGPSRAVCLADSGELVGKAAVRLPGHASPATSAGAVLPTDHPVGELSYWLLPQARGRGLATGAVQAMVELARSTLELRSLVMDIEHDNLPSIRVAARLGAERREPAREECDRQGVTRTMVVHVLRIS